MDFQGGEFWWNSLAHRVGLSTDDMDTMDRDFDPFRGGYEKLKDTYETAKKHLPAHTKGVKRKGVSEKGNLRKVSKVGPARVTPPTSNESLSNLHRSINTGSHGMAKRAATDGDEVPIMPTGKIAKIHPDYFTINLPYTVRLSTASEANFSFNTAGPFAVIRLNSIYDPMKQIHGGVSGNPIVESDLQPHGRHIWASHFKYYRVLKTYVKLTFMSTRHVPNAKIGRVFNENYIVGYELVDEDGQVSDHVNMFLMTKRAKRVVLKPCRKNTVFSSAGAVVSEVTDGVSSVVLTYVYNPGDWVHHVEELGSEERWTPITQSPAIDHDMAIRILHNDLELPVAQAGGIGVQIQLAYDVQFREGTDSFTKSISTAQATHGGVGEDPTDN